ncbi:MAG: hypothetical protein GTN43_00025, partial [Candidatus Aenigmarchaeota archaeon]|nr:hypothetical protein [Candidatus Aenigmarchaeota archaeon]
MVIREYEGRTEKDAIKKASEDLGVNIEQLKVVVLSEKAKFFSFGNMVKIRVYLEEVEEDLSTKAQKFLTELFGIIGTDISTRAIEEDEKIYI